MSDKSRSRWPLLVIIIAFLLPFSVAVVLRFGGWQPGQTRNFGQLLNPPISMQDIEASTAQGTWVFVNTEHEWSLLLRSAERCDQACGELVELIPNVRRSMGRHVNRLHLFSLDAASASDQLPLLSLQSLPEPMIERPAKGAEVWLVDPHGYLVMHYPSGFDPSGLRKDLSRLIR